MRLTKAQITTIKETVGALDKKAELYLFGSRIDDTKRGGDIDLLIKSERINRRDIWKIKDIFFEKFGEQKMDIIIDDGNFNDPFNKQAYINSIRL